MAKESSKTSEVAEISSDSGQVNRIKLDGRPTFTYIICVEPMEDPEDPEKSVICGLTVDVVENDDGLASEIVDKSVQDRDSDTYVCPRGHDGKLGIAE